MLSPHVIIWIVIGGFYILLIAWVRLVRKRRIANFDDLGVTTKAGKYYLWADLTRIRYFYTGNKLNKDKKIHSLLFYFEDGKAFADPTMKDISLLIQKADRLHVEKTEKIIGYY
jgi:hypothetical protein